MTAHVDEELAASYTPVDIANIRLTVRSSRSYDSNDVPSLTAALIGRRYDELPSRTSLEYTRLRKNDRLIVIYNSGAISCQGDDWQGAFNELRRFVVEARL
jgi:hypothetical protein